MLPFALATVLLDPPTALLGGTVLSLVSARLIAKDPQREVPKTAALSGLWAGVYGAAVGYMYFAFPDWMFAYLKDARDVPLWSTYLVFLAVLVAFGFCGGLAGSVLLSHKKLGAAVLLCAGAALSLLATFYLQWEQYQVVGTFAQHAEGLAPRLLDVPRARFGVNLASATAGVAGAAILSLRFWQLRRLPVSGRAP